MIGNLSKEVEQTASETVALVKETIKKEIQNIEFDTDNINDGAVTRDKIANDSITADKIASSAVTSSELSSGAVTNSKIAENAVTNSKIANEALTLEKFTAELQQSLWDVINHVADTTSNPHLVTKGQVGLGNVTNDKQATKAEYDNHRTATTIDHPDGSVTIDKLSEDVVTHYTNLLNPADISGIGTTNSVSVTINGLTPGKAYCFNFNPFVVMGGQGESVEYESIDGGFKIPADKMLYDYVLIGWDYSLYNENLYFGEGELLPPHFKPYNINTFINDDLLSSVYAEIKHDAQPINGFVESNGSLNPQINKIYRLNPTGDISFNLPQMPTGNFEQILIQANITQPVSIDWGTTHFFGKEVPTVEVGTYNFIFERDGGNWYAGVIEKGEAE